MSSDYSHVVGPAVEKVREIQRWSCYILMKDLWW